MGRPQHDREGGPAHDGIRQERSAAGSEQGYQDAPADRWRGCSKGQYHGRPQDEQRGRDHHQQKVLDHVHREQSMAVGVDRGLQREVGHPQAHEEAHGPPAGKRRGRRTHPRTLKPPCVGQRDDAQPQHDKGVEGPGAKHRERDQPTGSCPTTVSAGSEETTAAW